MIFGGPFESCRGFAVLGVIITLSCETMTATQSCSVPLVAYFFASHPNPKTCTRTIYWIQEYVH